MAGLRPLAVACASGFKEEPNGRMSMRGFLPAAAALFLLGSGAATAAPVEPTGTWAADFAPAACQASRRYGDDILAMKFPPFGDVVQVALFTRRRTGGAEQIEGSIQLDGQPRRELSMLSYNSDEPRKRVYLVNMTRQQFAELTAARELRMTFEGRSRHLALRGMGALMKVVDECVADLKKVWNVRPEDEMSYVPGATREPDSTGATGDLSRFFSGGDYPMAAARAGQTGQVSFALLVDEQGRIADCTLTSTSGIATLDAQSCIILRERGRMTPATGPDGKPRKDAVLGRILWKM